MAFFSDANDMAGSEFFVESREVGWPACRNFTDFGVPSSIHDIGTLAPFSLHLSGWPKALEP